MDGLMRLIMEEELVFCSWRRKNFQWQPKGRSEKNMNACLPFLKSLDICISLLLWYSYFNNMYFVFKTIACTTGVDSNLGSLFVI